MEHDPENNYNTLETIIKDIDEMNSHSIQRDEAIVRMLEWIKHLAEVERYRPITEESNKASQDIIVYDSKDKLDKVSKRFQDEMGMIERYVDNMLNHRDTFDISVDVIARVYIEMHDLLHIQNELLMTYNNILSIIEEQL